MLEEWRFLERCYFGGKEAGCVSGRKSNLYLDLGYRLINGELLSYWAIELLRYSFITISLVNLMAGGTDTAQSGSDTPQNSNVRGSIASFSIALCLLSV